MPECLDDKRSRGRAANGDLPFQGSGGDEETKAGEEWDSSSRSKAKKNRTSSMGLRHLGIIFGNIRGGISKKKKYANYCLGKKPLGYSGLRGNAD